MPTPEEVKTYMKEAKEACPHVEKASTEDMHKKAQDYLKKGNVDIAWKILLA